MSVHAYVNVPDHGASPPIHGQVALLRDSLGERRAGARLPWTVPGYAFSAGLAVCGDLLSGAFTCTLTL